MVDGDGELLQRWGRGDEAAGRELYDRHFSMVYRFFRTKVVEGIDDLVQSTFLACLEARDRYRGEGKFSTFVYGIARNMLLTHFRKTKWGNRIVDAATTSVADVGPSPSSMLGRNDRELRLYEAITSLPIDLQIALELFYWEDVPSREVAEIVGVPESTIRSRLRRARQQLRRALDMPPEPSDSDAEEADPNAARDAWIERMREATLADRDDL